LADQVGTKYLALNLPPRLTEKEWPNTFQECQVLFDTVFCDIINATEIRDQ
jgi:hypothetical protein